MTKSLYYDYFKFFNWFYHKIVLMKYNIYLFWIKPIFVFISTNFTVKM